MAGRKDNMSHKKIERILLVSPHYVILKNHYKTLTPPLGLAYIAAVLEKAGYEVKVLDVAAEGFNHDAPVGKRRIKFGLGYDEIKKRIKEFKPQVVGVSCIISNQFESTKSICKVAKEACDKIITVVGGGHPSALPREALQSKSIDFVVIGEGEKTILELVKCLEKGEEPSHIDGLAFKKNDKTIVNPKTAYIENLDQIPFPARHLLPMDTYFKISLPQGLTYTKTPNTAMLTSRGCSANCIFCATTRFWGNKYRTRSPENVIAEIDELVKNYGIKEIQFIDDNLTLNKKRAIAIFRSIKKRFKIAWSTPQGIAPWALDEELIKEMKDSGCYEISLAVESGDQDILKQVIRKPGSLDKIKRLVKEINKLKMMSKGFFVIGLPGETKEQIQKTFKFALDIKLDSASFFLATPLPGTRLYSLCVEKGYLKKGFDFNSIDYNIGNIKTPDFTPDELERLLNRQMAIFNLKLFMRNPIKFIRKYTLLLTHNPRMMVKYVLGLIKNWE